MADITMCPGEGCPERSNCVRYTTLPSSHQSYGSFDDDRAKEGWCRMYWPEWVLEAE